MRVCIKKKINLRILHRKPFKMAIQSSKVHRYNRPFFEKKNPHLYIFEPNRSEKVYFFMEKKNAYYSYILLRTVIGS